MLHALGATEFIGILDAAFLIITQLSNVQLGGEVRSNNGLEASGQH
jgi:hypothetical protein